MYIPAERGGYCIYILVYNILYVLMYYTIYIYIEWRCVFLCYYILYIYSICDALNIIAFFI